MSILESLQWRAAIKQFDTTKKVSAEDLEKLIEAANLAPTSGGLQPLKLVVVSNAELQSKLVPMSYGQQQVASASHILVFAIETNLDTSIVDRFVERMAEVRDMPVEQLEGYRQSMHGYIGSMDEATIADWARRQAYISLGTVMAAAADMRIDSCPMEGFDPIQYQEILGLKEKNLMPTVILPIGYRSDEDVHSKSAKVRKKTEDFLLEVY